MAKAYTFAVEQGEEEVSLHIEWIAETLCYLDGLDKDRRLIEVPLDDQEQQQIDNLYNAWEQKVNGNS